MLLVVRESACVSDPASCVHGTCEKPEGCKCEPGWMGQNCDMARSHGAHATPSHALAAVVAMLLAVAPLV